MEPAMNLQMKPVGNEQNKDLQNRNTKKTGREIRISSPYFLCTVFHDL